MTPLRISLGPWLPDHGALNNPGCLDALNAIPERGYYRAINSLATATDALTPNPQSGFWAERPSTLERFTFVGTDNGLFRSDSSDGSWDDVSNGDMSSASNWRFAQFGDLIIAVAEGFAPQSYDLTGDPASTTFQNLAGSPPTAIDVAVVGDFVVLAQPGGARNQIRWSGFNNANIWSGIPEQSDINLFNPRIGRVQRVVSGEQGVVICEHAVFTMRYVGPPLIYSFREIENNLGTPAPDSVCQSGDRIFFYAHTGFSMLVGSRLVDIGYHKVDRFFLQSADMTLVSEMRGVVDRTNRLVFWMYKSGASSAFDRMLIYNWAADAWSRANIDALAIFENVDPGQTLDSLDNILPGGIDANSINVDTPAFSGGTIEVSLFATDRRMGSLSGTPLTASFESREMTVEDRTYIDGVRPEVEGVDSTLAISVGTRKVLNQAISFSGPVAPNPDTGVANYRVDTRYYRLKMTVSGGFNHARSMVMYGRKAGFK